MSAEVSGEAREYVGPLMAPVAAYMMPCRMLVNLVGSLPWVTVLTLPALLPYLNVAARQLCSVANVRSGSYLPHVEAYQ